MAATVAVLTPEQLREMLEEAAEKGAERAMAREAPASLTTARAARIAGVEPETIREWHRAGRLRAKRDGRTLRIERSDLDRAMAGDADPDRLAAEHVAGLRRSA